MGALDQLAAAGFSQSEMDGYAAQQRQTLSAGGFSSQEIDGYLGGSATQQTQPHPDTPTANQAFAQAVGNHLVDAHNLVNVGTGKDAMQTMADIGTVYAPLEAALNVATGTLFGFPAYVLGGAAGLFDKHVLGNQRMDPEALAESLSHAVTYQPHTEAGQRLAGAAQYPLQVLNDASLPAGNKVADIGQSMGLSNTASSWAGAFTAAAIQTLPAVLLGELGRKMGGQRIMNEDMQNVSKVIAGPDAHPDVVQSVEKSLRSTYQQTGIGPYTVLEQSRADPQLAADLKNPEVDVPQAFQQYARSEQVGVPVSDAMKAVRPLEADTPPPGPVEMPDETEPPPAATNEAETATEAPVGETSSAPGLPVFTGKTSLGGNQFGASIGSLASGTRRQLMVDPAGGYFWGDYKEASARDVGAVPEGEHAGHQPALFENSADAREAANSTPQDRTQPGPSSEIPEEGFGEAQNPQNLTSEAPERTNTQLADALSAALKARDIDRAYAIQEAQIDAERDVIGNRADAARLAEQAENGEAEAQNQANAAAEGGGSFSGVSPEPRDNTPLGRLARERLSPQDRNGITLMHSGLNPTEAIQNLRVLAQRLMQTDLGQKVSQVFGDALRDLQMKTTPMAAGSERAMAIAKDAANSMRKAAWQWGAFDDLLRRGYTQEQRERMWNAAEEENTLRTQGITDNTRGLGSLTDDERQTVETLSQYGNQLLQRARDVGMFQGEGVAYWTPRMVAMIGEDGEVSLPSRERVSSAEGRGGNVTTSASSLKGRQHATAEETEAAAKAKFGEGATVVRDIRTMPLAMARIERAIAGRELVNRIKDVGLQIGQELVSSGEKPEMFTIDHPAFKTYRAGEDGAMERVPLYVSKEFEGPLKSIMTEKSGALYKAFMGIKGRVMSMIMYSPLIHNMVEWGRALPMMPGKVLTGRVYFEGNAAKHDPVTMRRAIDNGLVPIGHRFFNQDLTGLLEEPNIRPGRSLTAKAVGGAVGMVNEGAGEAVKAAIDKAGDVWHNTLLWDRVADLQMGLYTNLERDMIGKGLPPQTASRLAAHFANRYAGSLPNEAMSNGARKLANVALFSRTFTLGNLGAMKDMLTGLPGDVQAQLARDVGEAGRAGAVKVARQKAIHAFVTDIALLYVGNAIMQNAMDVIMRDKTIPDVLHGYANRFKDYLTRADSNPSAIFDIGSIFPNSQNEPGKENRIFFNTAPDGTAVYVRLPTGKIGEEFQGYLTSPLDMLKRKQGTLARPLFQTLENDKGFGQKVYDDQEPGLSGMLHAVGNVVWNILQQQVPEDSIQSGYNLMSGHGDDVDALKAIGPLFGLTFSKGAPGGPEVGVMFDAEKRHQNEVASAMPSIRKSIKDGDVQDAIQQMEDAHMTPQEQRATLKYAETPQARLNRSRMKKFEQIAPLDDLERMERMQEEEAAQSASQPDQQ
jgi:hypothetical protein